MRKTLVLLPIALVFIFAGCSQKVLIESTKPAKVDRAASKKKIAVMDFEKDNVHLGGKIEAALNGVTVEDKQFYTIVNRSAIDEIIKEQKFQYSGLANTKDSVKVGELLGAQALILGKVNTGEEQRTETEVRNRCLDQKCTRTQSYYVYCTVSKYSLTTNLRMIDVEKGDLIYTNNYIKSKDFKECPNDANDLIGTTLNLLGDKKPEKNIIYDEMANEIVGEFLPNISPTTTKFYVELLDSPEISYNKHQKSQLEGALEYLKHKKIDRAEEILSDLLTSTNDKCFVAAYNLGVVKEAKGELELAKQLYSLADRQTLKPNKIIIEASNRIDQAILDNEKLKKQSQTSKKGRNR
ncbi:CsgG/HfaB family protein [Arcobacter porcinus]|uniref:CsgG family protein n=1 Tax=Arcobacter porcinus TaxID=1935204 RepID=A0A5C2HK43_9BACT|nr:CsgG/HfaB family protein [Arcobacter porcinus]OCL86598.1 Curli production assembly/transport component CsgG [Arcobacter porcinus]OCL96818.1 Curli production assembly/transport component CsgG [Aliarcobacter thereius]QEP40648.1 CsgG family protein [Arcobacter porcinus]